MTVTYEHGKEPPGAPATWTRVLDSPTAPATFEVVLPSGRIVPVKRHADADGICRAYDAARLAAGLPEHLDRWRAAWLRREPEPDPAAERLRRRVTTEPPPAPQVAPPPGGITPPGSVRRRVRFVQQRWVDDDLVEIERAYPVEWDAVVPPDMRPDTHESDDLRNAPGAPDWVRSWHGPFYVTWDENAAQEQP